MNRARAISLILAGLIGSGGFCTLATAADTTADATRRHAAGADSGAMAHAERSIARGAAFLIKLQRGDGSFVPEQAPVGMNALVLKALVQAPGWGYEDPAVRSGYAFLMSRQLESGGIYKDSLANYNTAIAISALAAAERPEFRPAIDRAVAYLKALQWTDAIAGPKEEKIDAVSPWYGGFGYGGHSRGSGRPDLSNTQMALEALADSGLKTDDPAYQAAVKFIARLQNYSETNDQPWAGNDGGFVYSPADSGKGESMAGEYVGEGGRRMLRSYGSMTYAGLKSMIYAGLTKDDPRVKAAWAWISRNWTLDENPGMKMGDPEMARYGLYYYYHTLARALRVYGEPQIVDGAGQTHDWRVELIQKLSALQREDGSWQGERRWMEDNAVLATSYGVLALEEAAASLREKPMESTRRQ